MSIKILLVDDNEQFRMSLVRMLSDERYGVLPAAGREEAFALLKREAPELTLLDIRLGNDSGIDLLGSMLREYPHIPVVMLTGFGTIETAVESMKKGAADYIQKPVSYDQLVRVIEKNLSGRQAAFSKVPVPAGAGGKTFKIVSNDPLVNSLKKEIGKLTSANIPILLYGENGTGKELFANYIYGRSGRFSQAFIKINCAAFPDNLLDNELFGHEKGAYTGADSLYKGVFERADGGTLFLDEIGDMSLEVQAKVLRVLQNQELYRLGGKELIKVNVRIISATNKNLEDLILQKKFRQDLFFRLNAATVAIPPLRDRLSDIGILAETFLKENSQSLGRPFLLDNEVRERMFAYDWPGNIRELKNALQYACALTEDGIIRTSDLPARIREQVSGSEGLGVLDLSEKEIIISELKRSQFNKKKVARTLNMSRTTLYSKMRKYGIE